MDSGNEYSIMRLRCTFCITSRLDDCPIAVQELILDNCYSFKEWLIVKNYLSDEAVNEHLTRLLRALVTEEQELSKGSSFAC